MSAQTYVSFKNGGETDQKGWQYWWGQIFGGGVALGGNNPTALQATQHAGSANMSVDVQNGFGVLNVASSYYYEAWLEGGPGNVTVTAAHPSLGRVDTLVMYVDESVTQNTTANNPGALKFLVVPGTASGSPTAPSGATIQAAVGGSNSYYPVANISVAAGVTSIVTANISDLRNNIPFSGNLFGGPNNTAGHSIPNSPDSVLSTSDGWTPLAVPQTKALYTPTTITALGNRSFQLVFNGVDLTALLSPGDRLRLTRSTAAPTQCTFLNGSTQFYSKTSPAGMAWTNNFVVSAWVKLTSYAAASIMSRYNGTSGWDFGINASGQVVLFGFNGGSANGSGVLSYQSLPLNKWIHVTAQLDMATFTASTTTSYVMLDGVDVPASVSRGGTNPTSLVQAGNLEVGSRNGGTLPFPGKIAQAALYGAKITQATILASINQTLGGGETSLVSAYSFNNSVNDLNVVTANNLTATGGAAATNADSPFGGQAGGGINSKLEYGIVMSAAFATNTTLIVQAPEGCMIPTSGGLSALSYSGIAIPYGFPAQRTKWRILNISFVRETITIGGTNAWWASIGGKLNVPQGEWRLGFGGTYSQDSNVSGARSWWVAMASAAPAGISGSVVAPTSPGLVARGFLPSGAVNSIEDLDSDDDASLSTATIFLLYGAIDAATGTETWAVRADQGGSLMYADNSYL